MSTPKTPTVEVVSVRTILDTPAELVIERVMRVRGATRLVAEWEAPQSIWAAEPMPAKGQRGVRIRAATMERRGVWLLTIEFICKPRPI
jgi:hypothetical protein